LPLIKAQRLLTALEGANASCKRAAGSVHTADRMDLAMQVLTRRIQCSLLQWASRSR
jgi:hypothetical protein